MCLRTYIELFNCACWNPFLKIDCCVKFEVDKISLLEVFETNNVCHPSTSCHIQTNAYHSYQIHFHHFSFTNFLPSPNSTTNDCRFQNQQQFVSVLPPFTTSNHHIQIQSIFLQQCFSFANNAFLHFQRRTTTSTCRT